MREVFETQSRAQGSDKYAQDFEASFGVARSVRAEIECAIHRGEHTKRVKHLCFTPPQK